MAALASLIPELEDALRRGSPAKSAETLRRVTELFLADADRYHTDHVALFDDVLSRLVVEVETRALTELARRLAPVENAPPKLVRRLASDDDITVAGPVLLQSGRIAAADLVDIARTKSQAHLLAISSRRELDQTVTDVLVGRGDGDVVRNVARNPGARFSENGYSALVKRAGQDALLAERVSQRADIPPHLFHELLIEASEIVRQRLVANTRPTAQSEIRRILARVTEEIGAKANPPRDYGPAQRTVLALREAGKLGEPALAEFAKAGRFEETVAALAALGGTPVAVVDRLIAGDRPDPVLIICKALGFAFATVKAILELRAGGRRLSPQALDDAVINFERLSPATAQRVLRFWQKRQLPLDTAS